MNLKYDSDEQIIYVVKADGSKEVLEAEFPSEPVTSPDKTKTAFEMRSYEKLKEMKKY